MSDRIKEAYGIDSELIAGVGGIFDVAVDGDIIFSRAIAGRFPDKGEVVSLLKERLR